MSILNASERDAIQDNHVQLDSALIARANEIRNRVIQFREEEAQDFAEQIERTEEIPQALWQRMRELGFHKLTQPARFGGEGLPLTLYFPILEEIAHCHGSIRMVFHAYNSIWRTVGQGTEEQQAHWLSKLVNEGALVAFALTEPDNGTGIDLRTTATYQDGKYVLNGRKHLITFAHEAAVLAVIAKMEGSAGRTGLTAFLVPQGRAGMKLEAMSHMMGDKGCSHAVITFENCEVSEDEILGQVGEGFDVAVRGFLDQSRACIAMSAVGLAQEALDQTLAFIRKRVTFGKSIASRQAVQMRIAEMQMAIQGARLLCMDAAKKYDLGQDISLESSIAKANAIRMVTEVTDGALALFGGIGYSVDSPVERLYRDARSLWFEEGTAEMQKMTIAEALLTNARRREREAKKSE
ncbi:MULTISPECIES: acyl-CoA dehydrogenase family protein [Alicyclobacillus]|uniref:Acyl-CoA dehydrogenase family protein n=1 Tax=Alicyclobacillus acidoterrestris (strain ATCC 49025 / DSM 3922 / CIP 106132 / NCIMB 13137 / GD3B) TaxID=1356854 RepID=T0CJG8_ALIAG|nr:MULTISPECIES: acyl-CoA dehydrogenase family protein [Alicyclobacillus]EPZ52655.1 acyl-CoA dehydrogenase [Alicyclobacillus acidoterrestris ATCC 49025]UNO48613.1 acyl-CoA dehydrogenase family protein [Alicyclobacillus acidoterrestris]GEO26030.1 acyl-CoA dehydrogenase [Alicyclobacillus acidoterrestris]